MGFTVVLLAALYITHHLIMPAPATLWSIIRDTCRLMGLAPSRKPSIHPLSIWVHTSQWHYLHITLSIHQLYMALLLRHSLLRLLIMPARATPIKSLHSIYPTNRHLGKPPKLLSAQLRLYIMIVLLMTVLI
jgi:hypothetical protein